jgi:methionyl-tRNA synthetase
MKPFYITTPIYYANDVPHIGHAYTTVAADVAARWRRLRGDAVRFLTGTDEHGSKIAQAAAAKGQSPADYLDGVVAHYKALWTRLNISHDDYIRTTEERHKRVVQQVFERLLKQGDIYLGSYEGWYCVPDETFFSDTEVLPGYSVSTSYKSEPGIPAPVFTPQEIDGDRKPRCPTCGRSVEKLKEESYFLRLSAYEKRLLDYYEQNPEFLQPKSRAPEIVQFVKGGLNDLSVSRVKVAWGIPVISNPRHTVYVWIDALSNYITALGYDLEKPGPLFSQFWPADIHLVGKEIYRFHAVIWPVMLMALGLPLPKQVFAHGWWTVEGEKMSKSKGNVVDPHTVADEYGVDAFRYFVLREVPFGSDGDFSLSALAGRYNAELANALGNLLNRVLTLLEKNFDGSLDVPTDHALVASQAKDWVSEYDGILSRLAFSEVLEKVMGLVSRANKYADEQAPWKLVKTDLAKAHPVLVEMARALKLSALALHPFMPTVTQEMWAQLGEPAPLAQAAPELIKTGVIGFAPGQKIKKGSPLFPRKEVPGKAGSGPAPKSA